MSIARMCLRFCTVEALANRTMAEDRVKDSSIVNLENSIMGAPKTVILAYTDDTEFAPQGKELWGGGGSINLVLIVAVAGANKLADGTAEFVFPPSDAATEMSLDITERQIQAALMDPNSVWAQRWRGIVTNVTNWKSQRGASTKEGQRFAARQIIITCETNHDPIPGAPVVGEWEKLLQVLAADERPDIAALAEPFRSLMEKPALVDWQRTMAEFGFDRQTLAGIGLAPFQFHPTTEAPQTAPLTTVTITGMGQTTEESAP